MKRLCIPIDMRNATRIKSAGGGGTTVVSEKMETHSTPLLPLRVSYRECFTWNVTNNICRIQG